MSDHIEVFRYVWEKCPKPGMERLRLCATISKWAGVDNYSAVKDYFYDRETLDMLYNQVLRDGDECTE